MKEFIDKIYDNTINILLANIPNNYHDVISQAYKNYLYKIHSDKYDAINYEKMINMIIDMEKDKWSKMDAEYIIKRFTNDENYKKIRELSGKAYLLAKEKLLNELEYIISKEEAEKNIDLLNNLLPTVQEFNKAESSMLVSEGICDFVYASRNVDVTSLRLGHLLEKRMK